MALLAGAMGAMVLTHNLTALVALPAAGVVGLFGAWRGGHLRRGAGAVGGGLALALALSAFFWLPALAEQRHVQIHVALDGGHKAATSWLIDPLGATGQTRRAGNPQTVPGPLDLHWSYPYDLNYPPKPSLGQGVLFGVSLALLLAGALARARRGAAPGTAAGPGGVDSASLAPALFFGAGTLALWLLTTTWSAWVWDHAPLMRFLQFSWRLYGPLALALGLLAAGGAALWRRTPALALLPLAAVAFLAFNATTARPLWLNDTVERRVGGPQLVGTENATFGAGTTTGGEFVPRTADLEALGPGKRRGNGVYERLYPEFGWLAGRTRPLEGTLRVAALAGGPTWTEALVEAETPGVLAFRTLAFPGWRAYLDGREVPGPPGPPRRGPGRLPRLPHRRRPGRDAPGADRLRAHPPAQRRRGPQRPGPRRPRLVARCVPRPWGAGPGAPGPRASRGAPAPGPAPGGRTWRPAALLALACTHDAVRPVLGAPASPRPGDARLVADLSELARTGGATVESPAGRGSSAARGGAFVSLQRLAIEPWEPGPLRRERRWLYMHPPASLSASISLPHRAAFQAGLALDPRTWHMDGADGVRYIVEVTTPGGEAQRVLDEHVNPRARGEHRAWLDRWVDLSAFGGQRVTLTLRTEAARTPDFDWAGWADPVVIVQRDARRPGGGPRRPSPPRAPARPPGGSQAIPRGGRIQASLHAGVAKWHTHLTQNEARETS